MDERLLRAVRFPKQPPCSSSVLLNLNYPGFLGERSPKKDHPKVQTPIPPLKLT